jgi:hypothetical protein
MALWTVCTHTFAIVCMIYRGHVETVGTVCTYTFSTYMWPIDAMKRM